MDATERELLATTVRDAIASIDQTAGPAALDAVLDDLGWREMLATEARDAIDVVFGALGLSNATATVLDDVLLDALGTEPRPDRAVVLPAFGTWAVPGRRVGDAVEATGLTSARITTATDALVAVEVDGSLHGLVVPVSAIDARRITGVDPDWLLHTVEVRHPVDGTDTIPLADEAWDSMVVAGRRAVAHQIAGACRTMLDLARTHALEREQFGRPIARFQAVRHRLADAFVACEALDATLTAAWDEPGPMTAALAKAHAGHTATIVAAHCQQVLAGIGFTTDHSFHRFLKRTMVLDGLLGSTDALVADIGRELLAARTVPTLIEL